MYALLFSDPDFKGTASEERFKAFLRRSSLQDRLTATQLRRLENKCKVTHNQAGKRKTDGLQYSYIFMLCSLCYLSIDLICCLLTVYDYEKFCQLLSAASSKNLGIGKIKSETVFNRFSEASLHCSADGRPFLFFCSLVDRKMTGSSSLSFYCSNIILDDFKKGN